MSLLILPLRRCRREGLLVPSTDARLQHLAQVLLSYLANFACHARPFLSRSFLRKTPALPDM